MRCLGTVLPTVHPAELESVQPEGCGWACTTRRRARIRYVSTNGRGRIHRQGGMLWEHDDMMPYELP